MINWHMVEPASLKKKVDAGGYVKSLEEGGQIGGSGRRFRPSLSILRRTKREQLVKKTALGFRVFGFLFCLVSLSVMAADKNKGWAIDSFDRYKEFRFGSSLAPVVSAFVSFITHFLSLPRYCLFVNIIGFVYSRAQALDLDYQLLAGTSILQHHFRYFFDFSFDQASPSFPITCSMLVGLDV